MGLLKIQWKIKTLTEEFNILISPCTFLPLRLGRSTQYLCFLFFLLKIINTINYTMDNTNEFTPFLA